MKKNLNIFLLFFISLVSFTQDDLLNEIDTVKIDKTVSAAFKSLKIVNLESTKLLGKKELYFVVAHRFGSIKDGFEGFFGLDNAVTQIKFIYGLNSKISIGAGRSEQAYDFSIKYLIASQRENGLPFTFVGFNSVGFNNQMKESNYPRMEFSDRMMYVNQILISRKFNDKLSLEICCNHNSVYQMSNSAY